MKRFLLILTLLPAFVSGQVKIAAIDTLQASFLQVRESAALLEPDVKSGILAFYAPDSIRWEYTELPNLQLPPQMLGMIRQTINGEEQTMSRTFTILWEDKTMRLKPKNSKIKRFFSEIRIVFANDGVARKVVLIDPNKDQTTIEFTNLRYKLQ